MSLRSLFCVYLIGRFTHVVLYRALPLISVFSIVAFLFLLNCDPNFEVRRAVLTCIAPSTKTLSSIIGRTRDVKETVRKVAYEVLSEKIHIKALSIALRLQLVNEGLSDRSGNRPLDKSV